MCKRSWKFVLLCAVACGCAGAEETSKRYYSHATELTLRGAPAADAAALLRLPINQALFLLARENSNWCKVRLADAADAGGVPVPEPGNSARDGYVGCAFLQEKPLDFATIETEAARLFLELNQPGLALADEARLLDRLFTQIERHFALSPSLYAYEDYRRLYETLRRKPRDDDDRVAEENAKPFRLQSRSTVLAAMRRALSRQTWERDFTPVRQSVMTTLRQVVIERRHGDVILPDGRKQRYTELPGGPLSEPASKASFFKEGRFAMGWAGGPMIQRAHGSHPVVYSVGFSGTLAWVLADVYEMAKAHRAPIQARFATVNLYKHVDLETLVLETRFPVWAITREGLVQGHLRKANFGGTLCDGPGPINAEIEFGTPIKGQIYGVFASSAPVDPVRAKVSIRGKTFLEGYELDNETATLTNREMASVDLDQDGTDDLRVLLSTDQVAHNPARPQGFRRVGGWYAYDVYSMEANESGWWRLLSRYNLSTCT
jgi:hypothetical protein